MIQEKKVKVSPRYQISIPSQVRAELGIEAGDYLLVRIDDGSIVLRPEPASYTKAMAGLHREIWQDVDTDEYLLKERRSWDNED